MALKARIYTIMIKINTKNIVSLYIFKTVKVFLGKKTKKKHMVIYIMLPQ